MITVQGRGTRTAWTPELKQISAGGTVGDTGWTAATDQSWYTYNHGTVTAIGVLEAPTNWAAIFTSGYEWAINYPSGMTPATTTQYHLIGRAETTVYLNRGADFVLSMYGTGAARNASYPIRLVVARTTGLGHVIITGDNADDYFPQFFGDYSDFYINMQYRCDV